MLDVSPSIVHFTAEFKALFYQVLQAGKEPCEITAELGMDPEILGGNRVNGLRTMVKNEVKAGKGFRGSYIQRCLREKIAPQRAIWSRSNMPQD